MLNRLLAGVIVGAAAPFALADGFGHAHGHEVSQLASYECHHVHADAELLGELRLAVNRAVRANAPQAAVAPLKQIITVDPHDYYAWEFLGYTYSVLGDVASAANVDLDLVTLFEYIPTAAPQVSRAMARLRGFDPQGWQARVEAKRRAAMPHVPVEAMNHFIDTISSGVSVERRRTLYTKIERVLVTHEHRSHFIEEWKSGIREEQAAAEEMKTCATCKLVFKEIAGDL
jgi:hypothetical protein